MSEMLQADEGQGVGAGGSDGDIRARQDPLSELEHRWGRLAEAIRASREENAVLQEQLREGERQIVRLEQEAVAKAEEVAALSEDKRRTILRIESLLARFDDLGQ